MKWAVIGGSGFEKFEEFQAIEELDRQTPFGLASSGLKRVGVQDHEVLFLSRHGSRHELLPSEINYRANIYALKKYGAEGILSFSAVGSLGQEWAPGDLVVPNQYIDRTKSLRNHSFCGEGLVGHMSLANPTSLTWMEALMGLKDELSFKSHFKKCYVCIEGPNFSTRAESLSYRQMGADIIGMTNFPEYALAREAGLEYLPCCFVTDYDCWDENIPHVTLAEVIQVMRENNKKAFEVLKKILAYPGKVENTCADQGLKQGVMSSPELLNSEQRAWLKVLQS